MATLPKELQVVIMKEAAKGMSIDQRRALKIGPGKLHTPLPLRDMLDHMCDAKLFIINVNELASYPWPTHDQRYIMNMLSLRSATLSFRGPIKPR